MGPSVLWASAARTLGLLSLLCLFQHSVLAQAGITCSGNVNLQIHDGCELIVYPQNMLSGTQLGNPADYTVDVAGTGTNVVTLDHVGQTIMISVIENASGNSCWGFATVAETGAPTFTACIDTTLTCLDDPRPVSAGGDVPDAVVVDCSPTFPAFYQDVVQQGACTDNFTQRITRTWSAEDIYGNVGTCTQIITLTRLFRDDLAITCPADVTMSCALAGNDTSPAATGYPTAVYNGLTYSLEDQPCDLMVFKTDQVVDKCGAGELLVRTWSVMDMCPNGNPALFTCVQEIKIVDDVAPVVTAPADVTIAANTNSCTAQYVLPAASAVDCSGVTFNTVTPIGIQPGNGGAVIATGLPLGTNLINYIATDECGNTGAASTKVTVEDQTPPQVNCELIKQIGLNAAGEAIIPAFVFDNASTDNCCDTLTFRARRLTDNCGVAGNTAFHETVAFCCSDIGTTVMVELEVSDCHGNTSLCTVQVNTVDEIDPEVMCPPDITISCAQDPYDLSIVGDLVTDPALQTAIDGLTTDACSTPLVSYQDNNAFGACGDGVITRSWAVEAPGASLVCIQRITIENNDPFTCDDVTFPADATLDYCNVDLDPSVTGEPVIAPDFDCADLSVEYSDVDATGSTAACRKILRTWIVTDLCQYDAADATPTGRCEYQQVIEVIDDELPVFTNCLPRNVCNENPDCGPALSDLSINVSDACTDLADLQLIWFVDLDDDGVTDSGAAFSGAGINTTNFYPNGTHRILYRATDPCGNVAECSFLFTVEDCLEPDAVCPNGIALTLDANGQGVVTTNQFNMTASSDNCSQVLSYSFSADVNDNVRTYDCDDRGVRTVEIWATDPDGNQAFCTTTVNIQDNTANVCGAPLVVSVAGHLRTEDGAGVAATVELSGGTAATTDTDTDGRYQFDNLPAGQDYFVRPELSNDPLNGVSTFDIVLISKHILGTQLLDSPYQLIAADVNGSQSISTLDIVQLRKLILHLDTAFPGGQSWRFVDGQYTFTDPTQPWDAPGFPEVCTLNAPTGDQLQTDFIAVKLGDVNGTANVQQPQADDRQRNALTLTTADRSFTAGETFTVALTAAQALTGYQLALQWDDTALELLDYAGAAHTAANFHAALNTLRVSWNAERAATQLCSLTLRAKTNGRLSDQLRLAERLLPSEGVAEYNAAPLQLHFGAAEAATLLLHSISPNPFRDAVRIQYEVPTTVTVTRTLLDARGQVVYTDTPQNTAGLHQWILNGRALGLVPGLYFVRLQTDTHTLTHKVLFQN